MRPGNEGLPTSLQMSHWDRVLTCADNALRTLSGAYTASRRCPGPGGGVPGASDLEPAQRRLSGALMRVNHVGEVCAQALYSAQRLAARDSRLQQQFEAAARDEFDHLAWTHGRLRELGDRPSLLNPLWYAGAFGFGLLAGGLGRRVSLGFVAETEAQVEEHLQRHLHRLPANDHASRAIVQQMKDDEARHAADALQAGGIELPAPAKAAMRLAAKVMTRTAHHV
jgi:ubiquinone biosynthesis monooxygenase Coq7